MVVEYKRRQISDMNQPAKAGIGAVVRAAAESLIPFSSDLARRKTTLQRM